MPGFDEIVLLIALMGGMSLFLWLRRRKEEVRIATQCVTRSTAQHKKPLKVSLSTKLCMILGLIVPGGTILLAAAAISYWRKALAARRKRYKPGK
jgi:uncharacterized iron-regulated membrane protein